MTNKTEPGVAASYSSDLKLKGFKVQEISGGVNPPHSNGRRDFYKIVLVTGDMIICYCDATIEINDTFLFFADPNIPILLLIVP